MTRPQGSVALLDEDVARRLLGSTIPARYAYTTRDGMPRVVASWFHWTGEELVMPTFLAAPHVVRPPARIAVLRQRPDVAVTIDTEAWPPEVLQMRGRVTVTDVDGVSEEYALAAHRYLGEEQATAYLAQIDEPGTRMARIGLRPEWVALLDFQTRLPEALGGVQS